MDGLYSTLQNPSTHKIWPLNIIVSSWQYLLLKILLVAVKQNPWAVSREEVRSCWSLPVPPWLQYRGTLHGGITYAYQFTWGTEISYRQLSVYSHHSLYRNYYIFYCLCAWLVQLQLIRQVHYINNTTSHNKNSHAIHKILIWYRTQPKWTEISDTKCRWILV